MLLTKCLLMFPLVVQESDKTLDESRKKVQADVDDKLVAQVSKDALLKAYLSSKFSLKNGDKPHEMNF